MRFGDSRGSYQIVDLPGSPQCAVSIHSFIFPALRGNGHGKDMHAERLLKLRELGYNYVICTVNASNMAEVKILQRNGWTKLSKFVSSSTGHTVNIYGRKVQ